MSTICRIKPRTVSMIIYCSRVKSGTSIVFTVPQLESVIFVTSRVSTPGPELKVQQPSKYREGRAKCTKTNTPTLIGYQKRKQTNITDLGRRWCEKLPTVQSSAQKKTRIEVTPFVSSRRQSPKQQMIMSTATPHQTSKTDLDPTSAHNPQSSHWA